MSMRQQDKEGTVCGEKYGQVILSYFDKAEDKHPIFILHSDIRRAN
jgi:hypothetical protein